MRRSKKKTKKKDNFNASERNKVLWSNFYIYIFIHRFTEPHFFFIQSYFWKKNKQTNNWTYPVCNKLQFFRKFLPSYPELFSVFKIKAMNWKNRHMYKKLIKRSTKQSKHFMWSIPTNQQIQIYGERDCIAHFLVSISNLIYFLA